ncbi:hypothetical protein BH10PSE1_BH10PSE1_27360 [soil metagenome]
MDFKVEYRVGVQASAERIWSFIGDLRSWTDWNPVETDVEGAIAFGGQISLTEAIAGRPERHVTARIGDWQPEAQLVWIEKRGWLFNVTRYYEIEALGATNCIVSNGMIFSGLRGEGSYEKNRKLIKPALASIGEALRSRSET